MRIKMPAVRIAQADTDPTQSTGGTDQVDLLTCGQCQRVFLLSDICRFVQHKVTGCSKDPLLATNCNSGAAGDDNNGAQPPSSATPLDNGLLSAAKSKSSSHHHHHNHLHNRSQSPAGADDPLHQRRPPPSSTPKRTSDRNNGGADDGAASSEDEKSAAGRVKQGSESSSEDLGYKKSNRSASSCVDAESNTTNTEPSSFMCCTCKARFNSSWKLLQHAQAAHSMKIYTDGTPSPVSQSKNNSSCSSLGSSGCSSNASSLPGMSALPLALSMPPRLNLHPPPPQSSGPAPPPPPPSMVDTAMSMPLHNPFGVGGLLRMPMGEPPQRPSPFPGTSPIGNPPLFGRSSAGHQDHGHQFRMEQLMSEQFRLNQQQHGLGFAVAVAAANAMPTSPFPGLAAAAAAGERNNPRHPAPTLPALSLDPQMDFYSQRLRQLAGTTSPGAATAPSSSPSPRKMTPPFSSPSHHAAAAAATTTVGAAQPNSASAAAAAAIAAAVSAGLNNNNNNNSNVSNNNSVERTSPSDHDRAAGDRNTLDLSSASANNVISKDKQPAAGDATGSPQQQQQQLSAAEEEKTRECEYCGKKFRFLSNLIVHRRTHTGEKPYKCSVCDHACTQSSKLKRHMKTHRRSSNRGNGLAGGECGTTTANGVDTSSTPDLTSNEDDEDDSEMDEDDAEMDEEEDDEDDEDDAEGDEDDEEEEEEDMELEDEDNDENESGDVPEDLTTKSTTSSAEHHHDKKQPGGRHSSHASPENTPAADRPPSLLPPLPPSSLVGELMSKFGLSNIQQYSEAYKQALKESSALLPPQFRVRRKDGGFRLSSPVIADNNNGTAKSANPLRNPENGLSDKTVADLRFREELTKNLIAAGQSPLDLVGAAAAAHHGIFGPGSAFENPFDPASKRLKLDPDNPHHPLLTRDRLYAAGMWLPALAAHHRGESFLGGLPGAGTDRGGGGKSLSSPGGGGDPDRPPRSKPGPSSLSAALNLGLSGHQGGGGGGGHHHHAKKESRRNDTCEYCGKVFKNCSNLTVHRRSHTGEKPYKCELCSYACAQSSKLTRHMKTHGRLGKDVYRCRFCEMPFSVPSTLEKHMRKCVVNQNIKLDGGQYIKMQDDGSSNNKLDGPGAGGYLLPVDDESYSGSAVSKDNT